MRRLLGRLCCYVDGHLEKFRAKLKAGLPGGGHVDGEADFPVLEDELNHPAVFQKSRKATDGQDGFLLKGDQVFREPALFGLTDEEDLAVVTCRGGRQSPDDELASLVSFIRNEGIKRFAKTVFAEDADSERGGVVAGVGRPTDKLFKVV